VVGGVHALRPAPDQGVYQLYFAPSHRLADGRGRLARAGHRPPLLQAAENWLYYCPIYLATETTPLYGSVEGPRPPLFGSSQRMGVSLRSDRPLIDWLARRGYAVVEPGDVSLARELDGSLPAAVPSRTGTPWACAGCDQPPAAVDRPWLRRAAAVGRQPRASVWWRRAGRCGRRGCGTYRLDPPFSLGSLRCGYHTARRCSGVARPRSGSYLLDQTLHGLASGGHAGSKCRPT
jgi:hypothetical protein